MEIKLGLLFWCSGLWSLMIRLVETMRILKNNICTLESRVGYLSCKGQSKVTKTRWPGLLSQGPIIISYHITYHTLSSSVGSLGFEKSWELRERMFPCGPVQCRCLSNICMMHHPLKTFCPISGFLFSDNFSQRIKYLSVGTHCLEHKQKTVLL